MKRRIYFMIASIISILLSVYSIIISNQTVKTTIEQLKEIYKDSPQSFSDRVIGMYEKSGVRMIILFASIIILLSVIIFIISKNNTLLKHKGLVISFSVLFFLFSDISFIQLIAVTNIIVMVFSKRINPEDFPDKKEKELPKIDIEKSSLKEKVLGFLLLLVYFSQFLWSKYLPDDYKIVMIVEITFNVIMLILCILVFYKQIKENFKLFKDNIKAYMMFIMPRIGISYVFLFIASMISVIITRNGTSINQETLELLPKLYSIPAAIIYAPIVEEILFRGVFRRFIKNNIIFIIISAFTFGILHTIGESSILNIIVMSLPYASLGAYLAYAYTKTNNIFTSITSHAIFNTISSVFTLFL